MKHLIAALAILLMPTLAGAEYRGEGLEDRSYSTGDMVSGGAGFIIHRGDPVEMPPGVNLYELMRDEIGSDEATIRVVRMGDIDVVVVVIERQPGITWTALDTINTIDSNYCQPGANPKPCRCRDDELEIIYTSNPAQYGCAWENLGKAKGDDE